MTSFDSRALQYYREKIADALGGTTGSDFWQSTILQISETELAVRQALMAVSELFEAQAQNPGSDLDKAESSAMESYRKALLSTAKRIDEPEPEPVALATCILFLCIHCLHGDREQASKMLRSGSGIMQKVLNRLSNPNAFQRHPTASLFLPVFERLVVLLRFFGEILPHFRESSRFRLGDFDEILSQPKTFEDARTTLHWLVAETHDLLVEGRPHRASINTDPEHLEACLHRQRLQISAYATWYAAFQRLDAETDPAISTNLRKLLKFTYSTALVWLSTSLAREEKAHDRYDEQNLETVDLAEDYLRDNDTDSLVFTFEMGLIPPLYWTTIKCRNPEIRNRAFNLLKRAPAREGLWNRETALRVAARVIALETRNPQVVGNNMIFKDARVCDVRIQWTDEEGTHVTFLAKENDSTEITLVWQECIPMWYARTPEEFSHPFQTLFTLRGSA